MSTTSIHRSDDARKGDTDASFEQFCGGWAAGSGERFAAAYAENCHFIAFDGTILEGAAEIAAFHQRAFDGPLRDTRLELDDPEIRSIGGDAWVAFAAGRIVGRDGSPGQLTGESVQTFVYRREGGKTSIVAFQNTRKRPITDPASAGVWMDFGKAWDALGR